MDIDVTRHIGAVRRDVTAGERDGRPTRRIVATRTYDTDIDDLWDAITNAERIPRWFLPVSGDLRPGGRYALEGNASGQIVGCEPPRHLALTWEFGGEVSWVDVRLEEEAAGGTRLELEHVAHVDDERWERYGPGAVGVGWDMTLMGLANHVATGAAVERDEAFAWMVSEQGRAFARTSSERWGAASIAAGTDEAAARAAAARTTAFYTGEPEPEGG